MPLVSRLIDAVGGRRAADADLPPEAEVTRLRQHVRVLESALRRAQEEVEQLRAQVRDRTGAASPATSPPVPRSEGGAVDGKAAGGLVAAARAESGATNGKAVATAQGDPVRVKAEAVPTPLRPEATKAEHVPAPEASNGGPTGGLAAAARAAAASGVATGTTFRRGAGEDPGEDDAYHGTNDLVIGETSYDEQVRHAEDGTPYWGPTDNESARARARGERLDIDREECIGCGTCVEHVDTVFWLDDDEGKAYVLRQEGAMNHIEDAIDACPVTCISWKAGGRPDHEQLPESAPRRGGT